MTRILLAAAALLPLPVQAWPPEVSGGITAIGQAASDDRVEESGTVSGDLILDQPVSGGAVLTLYVEGSTTVDAEGVAGLIPESNGDAGSTVDDRGDGRVQVSELRLRLPAGTGAYHAGLIDPSGFLDQSRIASDENLQFLGANFVNNPTIAFPDYTLGALWERPAAAGRLGWTALLSSSHGLADTPGRAYSDLLPLDDDRRGAFAAVAMARVVDEMRWRIGAWVNTKDHMRVDGKPEVSENAGLYGQVGWSGDADAVNLRLGTARPSVSMAQSYAAVTWQRRWDGLVLGLGVAGVFVSRDAEDAADSANAELYLRWRAARGLYLTPSLQYVRNPGLDGSGAVVDRDVGIANLRLSWVWPAP